MLRMIIFLNSIFWIKHLTIFSLYICYTEFKFHSLSHIPSLKAELTGYLLPEVSEFPVLLKSEGEIHYKF